MEEKRFDGKEQRFRDAVLESIQGPPKFRIPITFPEQVLKEFAAYAKENSADCYWLAIKQLLDFKREQLEGDLKSVILMQQIQDLREILDEVDIRLSKLEQPRQAKERKTFGQKEEKKNE
ncbi:MAG: hypothetical protein Q8O88_01345 [bacterium]|nr:hypothetical protein [bacterium]